MILDSSTRSLQVVLAGAKTTTDCNFVASYVDTPAGVSAVSQGVGGTNFGSSSGVTVVAMVPAPGGGNIRRTILEFTFTNTDSAAVTPSFQIADSAGTTKTVFMPTLQVGDTLEWIQGYGFSVTDNTGALKQPSAQAPLSISATKGVGYAAGAGGAVTQATSKATGVTLNTVTGAITMNAASLAAATSVGFVLTNSTIVATDTLVVSIKSGGTVNSYAVTVDAVAAGSATIQLRNISGGSLAEAVVLNFAILRGAAS